jgi:hypothetical protein
MLVCHGCIITHWQHFFRKPLQWAGLFSVMQTACPSPRIIYGAR